MGMLMWGLTLRHAWGVTKDEKGGFAWVKRAAEEALKELERGGVRVGMNSSSGSSVSGRNSSSGRADDDLDFGGGRDLEGVLSNPKPNSNANAKNVIKAELVLAVYEVGQCFFHGWGVKKDEKMGFSYYKAAAQLGDADAQNDLGFCLANGKGVRRIGKRPRGGIGLL
ncbi:hypothetical protein BDP27DRAFT_1359843 [Rhodocollybia butyracea]|uniref:Uncharacterized protein n=1 Tax=Rhodocollybia butyracea TaxID=206335 RepID=A0A9P5Q375_9AGAR|nr:hypothetical protein BDP27DRAFT_1359843 [Rhodocollybia butyracea]